MPAQKSSPETKADRALAHAVWLQMSDLVLDNDRRRAVSEGTGLSFGHTRALRRLARKPMSMGELATALVMAPPNVTTLVDELEALELVRRRPHPTDRRARLVETTAKGTKLAKHADEIISSPPPGLAQLSASDLTALREILERSTAADATTGPGA